MPYTKSITNIGLTWLANSVTSGHVIFDDIILSSAKNSKDTDSIAISDFTSPVSVGINQVANNDTGFTAIGLLPNASGDNYQVNMIGIVGHTNSNSQQQLIAVAYSTDDVPIFAVESSQVGNYNISFSIIYSKDANILINADNIPIANINDVKDAVNVVIGGYNMQLTSYATNSALNSLATSVTTNSASINNLSSNTTSSLSALQNSINSVASSGINPASISTLTNSINSNSSNIASLSAANTVTNSNLVSIQNTVNGVSSMFQSTSNSLASLIYSMNGYAVYDGNPFWIVQNSMMPINAQTSLTRYYSNGKIYIPGLDLTKNHSITITFDNVDNIPHYFPGLGFYQNDRGGNNPITNLTISVSQLQNGGSYNWFSGSLNALITAPTNNTLCFTGLDGNQDTQISSSGGINYYAVITSIIVQ